MATIPVSVTSSLSGPKFHAGRFWITRLATFGAVALFLYGFHTLVTPKLGIYDVRLLVLAVLFATLATSLNLINGITGQFSIGHAAFYLIGAISSGKLSVVFYDPNKYHPFAWLLLMVLAGAAFAAVAGLLVGLPSLRLRGDYLAVATLGFGEIVNVVLRNQDGGKQALWGLDVGGPYGLQDVPKLTEIWCILGLFILTAALVRNLLKSAHGLSFLSVREDEVAADATGVSTTRIKVTAFVLGAALAGMAGALFAHYNGSVSPDDFRMDTSFILVAMVVIGGTGSITGAAMAGIAMKLLEEGLRKIGKIPALDFYALILAGIGVILLYRAASQRSLLKLDGALRPAWSVLGALVCVGIAWLGYLVYSAELSWVLKVACWTFILGMLMAVLLTPARSAGLPRFGLFGVCLGLVMLIGPLVGKGLQAIGPLDKLLGQTVYAASDLRWAVFSVALIFVMILKPQGLLGHHELSWPFIRAFVTGRIGKGAR